MSTTNILGNSRFEIFQSVKIDKKYENQLKNLGIDPNRAYTITNIYDESDDNRRVNIMCELDNNMGSWSQRDLIKSDEYLKIDSFKEGDIFGDSFSKEYYRYIKNDSGEFILEYLNKSIYRRLSNLQFSTLLTNIGIQKYPINEGTLFYYPEASKYGIITKVNDNVSYSYEDDLDYQNDRAIEDFISNIQDRTWIILRNAFDAGCFLERNEEIIEVIERFYYLINKTYVPYLSVQSMNGKDSEMPLSLLTRFPDEPQSFFKFNKNSFFKIDRLTDLKKVIKLNIKNPEVILTDGVTDFYNYNNDDIRNNFLTLQSDIDNSIISIIYISDLVYSNIVASKSKINTSYMKNITNVDSEISVTKKQLKEWIGLKNVMSIGDVEDLLNVNANIEDNKQKLSELLFKKTESAKTDDVMLDEIFQQSFLDIKNRYNNVYANEFSDSFAPTGAKSQWSDEINEIIRSPLFKEWFGDWEEAYAVKDIINFNYQVSKVVNSNYEPQIVWHGTNNPFSYFKFDSFPAAYFAVNPEYSIWFAEAKAGAGGGYVYPFFLNVRNPLDLSMFGIDDISLNDFFSTIYIETGLKKEDLDMNPIFLDDNVGTQPVWVILRNNPAMLQKIAQNNIYDGIHFYEYIPNLPPTASNYKTEAWIVFKPENIKLADPERGTLLLSSLKSFILQKGGKI